jgi:hypothetical protein
MLRIQRALEINIMAPVIRPPHARREIVASTADFAEPVGDV